MSKAQQEINETYVKLLRVIPEEREVTFSDAKSLRRAALILHRWYEHECNGTIQRDEKTGLPYWYNSITGCLWRRAPDREKGAMKTIDTICKRLGLHYYLQTDPRGGTLYVSKEPIDQGDYTRATFIA